MHAVKVDKLEGFKDRERDGKEEDIIKNFTINKTFKAYMIKDQIFKHTHIYQTIAKITIMEKRKCKRKEVKYLYIPFFLLRAVLFLYHSLVGSSKYKLSVKVSASNEP